MRNILLWLLGFIFCSCQVLIFLSLGSIPPLSSLVIQLALSCGILFWGITRFLQKDMSRIHFLFPWLVLFLLWLLIQSLGQWLHLPFFFPHVSSWDERLSLFGMFVTAVAFYLAAVEMLRGRRLSLFLIQYLVCLSTLLAIYLVHAFFTAPGNHAYWFNRSPLWVDKLWPWAGTYFQPNHVVKLLFPGTFYAVSLAFYIYSHRHRDNDYSQRNLYSWIFLNLCFACVLVGAILLTLSRAGIMAFAAAFFFYSICFVLAHRRRKHALKRLNTVVIVAVLFLLTLGLKDVFKELQTISATVSDEAKLQGGRALTMGAGWQIVLAQGLWGVGLGNFQMAWLWIHRPPFDVMPRARFNDFLWLWAETGIPGVLLFFGPLGYFIFQAIRKAFKTHSYFVCYFLLAAAFSLVAMGLHALVEPTFYVEPLLWLSFIVLGFGAACLNKSYFTFPHGPSWNKIFICLFLCLSTAVGYFSAGKITAYVSVLKDQEEVSIRKAIQWDPLNSEYPEMLAAYYFRAYQKSKHPDDFEKAIAAVDHAIGLDDFGYLLYMNRAEMLLEAGDERGVRDTFAQLRLKLPNFYVGELTASIFYMESAIRSEDPSQVSYFEDLAIHHYQKAVELSPKFLKSYRIFSFGSFEADQQYERLRQEGRI